MFWTFEFAEKDLGELIHMSYLIELPDCSKILVEYYLPRMQS